MTNLERFYLRHQIRETLLLVGYDDQSADFKPIKKALIDKHGSELIDQLIKEVHELRKPKKEDEQRNREPEAKSKDIPAALLKLRYKR